MEQNSLTIAEVYKELVALEDKLPNSELVALAPFNTAYIVVTAAVQRAIVSGQLARPDVMERLSVVFANYYFQPVKLKNGAMTMDNPWGKVIDKTLFPAFMQVLLGAYVHIHDDLPQALLALGLSPDELAKDYQKLGNVITDCIPRILSELYVPKTPLRRLLKKASFVGVVPIRLLILYWRRQTWQRFVQTKRNQPYTALVG
ncbi:MAG: hypothetical protein JWS12_446 [Candidatus Saccharibacteria bacterium]|nr:hypothetical protein [Candidatus Saccharibacteria bacterium]